MNRIQNLAEGELESLLWDKSGWSEPAVVHEETGDSHCLFTPLHYERNYAYPLIVWLHGPGDDERQVTRVMPLVSMRNYVGVGNTTSTSFNAAVPLLDWTDIEHVLHGLSFPNTAGFFPILPARV